jgi:hypothetical protein
VTNPYASPSTFEHTAEQSHAERTRPVLLLSVLTALIVSLTMLSVTSPTPRIHSPYPFLVIFPLFFNVPLSVVAFFTAFAFTGLNYRHIWNNPKRVPGFGMAIALGVTTVSTLVWIAFGFRYGISYQGNSFTIGVVFTNALFACATWVVWFACRTPGRYRMQIALSFLLCSWLCWQAFPWMGELP